MDGIAFDSVFDPAAAMGKFEQVGVDERDLLAGGDGVGLGELLSQGVPVGGVAGAVGLCAPAAWGDAGQSRCL